MICRSQPAKQRGSRSWGEFLHRVDEDVLRQFLRFERVADAGQRHGVHASLEVLDEFAEGRPVALLSSLDQMDDVRPSRHDELRSDPVPLCETRVRRGSRSCSAPDQEGGTYPAKPVRGSGARVVTCGGVDSGTTGHWIARLFLDTGAPCDSIAIGLRIRTSV